MKNNIVRIKTYKGRGTGILYPCKYAAAERGYSSYLVFTCAHVLDNQRENFPSDGENIMDMVELGIYDDLGMLVEESDIREIRYHIPQNAEDGMCDIALFLVQIKSNIQITLETKIYQEALKNRELIYVEGYPKVMLNDDINQKIQLEGMYKELFPERSMVGMYQIKDDYHWYNDFQDLKLMEGFSGSPVYIEKNNEVYLLGMNQSVANIDKGENPFKIVYYLKMQYVLDCLRQSDCIIFRTNRDGSMDIEWVLGQRQDGEEINILMLGGSGAGKSSFTKTFAYHNSKLKITNDGQTTRSNVFYQFSLFPKKCKVKVSFFSKKDFVKKMEEQLAVDKWLCFLQEIVGIEGARTDYTGYAFLKNIYPLFRWLRNPFAERKNSNYKQFRNKVRKEAKDIEMAISDLLVEDSSGTESSVKERWQKIDDCYDSTIAFLWKYIPVQYWKYCFDMNWWQLHTSDSGEKSTDADLRRIFELSKKDCSWKEYQEKIGKHFFDAVSVGNNNSDKEFFGKKFEGLCRALLHIEGFFDSKEVEFLSFRERAEWEKIFEKDITEEDRKRLIYTPAKKNDGEEEDSDSDERETEKIKMCIVKRNMDKICKYLFETLYVCFKEFIKKQELEFDLTEALTPEEEELMEKCFQLTSKGSLTLFVRNIVVEDKISDQYAWIIRRLHIKKLNILDSCGLDHVKNNIDDVSKIRNILTEHEKANDVEKLGGKSAIVYLKKLDSGKPDELRNILPAVVRAIPESPIYCVFTGIDIFYSQDSICLQDLNWSEQNLKNVPKSVKYLLIDDPSSDAKEKEQKLTEKADMLFTGTGLSDIRKRNLYLVLKNNLIPFCGNMELLQGNSGFSENNKRFVDKLLASILIDEVGSMEIVVLNEDDLKKSADDIEEIIRMIFEKATIKNWRNIHHMIRRADYNRLSKKDGQLGYYSYVANVRLEWHQLFSDAYRDVIATEQITQAFIQKFESKDRAAIEAALMHMGEPYLFGNSSRFNQKEMRPDQTELRQALQDLIVNDLDKKENGQEPENRKITSDEIEKYLRRNTDFLKRYEESGNKEKYVRIFMEALKKQVDEDNRKKCKGLIQLNEEFENALHNLGLLFEMKYDDKNLLYIVMKEYFKGKADMGNKNIIS